MHTINDVAKMIGQSYSRVWHAYAYGRVPAPLRVGKTFILNETDIARLKAYFSGGKLRKSSRDNSRPGRR